MNYFRALNQYPQSEFASAILAQCRRSGSLPKMVLDAPCGNGEVTALLAGSLKSVCLGVDLSAQSIQFASTHYAQANLTFRTDDVYHFLNQTTDTWDLICIVNSLFLLPDPAGLLRLAAAHLSPGGRIMLVVPNVEGSNFLNFQKQHPGTNKLLLAQKDFDHYFQSVNLNLLQVEGVAMAHYYGRKGLRIFWKFYRMALALESKVRKRIQKNPVPAYFLIVVQP
jgi:2-polyprenyl-3-methyl-5-hydroxy-6-metoxy-1,4-benzoquinol methylase